MNEKTRLKNKMFDILPKLLLCVLVLGFCLFVGAASIHLFLGGMQGFNIFKPSTYGQARKAIDSAYAAGLLAAEENPQKANDPTKPQTKTMDGALKSTFVDINGLATKALGQRELNSIIKLDNGYITAYLPQPQDLAHQLQKTAQLNQFVQEKGGKFVFVMAPHLINKYQPLLPPGFVDYFNQTADEFLAGLAAAGVATIDLREIMHSQGFEHYAGFFSTDHHWTPAAASWANDRVMRQMMEWGWLNAPQLDILPEDFAVVNQGVSFYGTAAERTGQAFAGQADILQCVQPKMDVPLSTKRYGEEQFSGPVPFEAVYRDWQHAEPGRVYGPDAYYLYKTTYEMTVLNENAPADNHITFICDSFGVPFQSFTSCYVKQLTAFDARQHTDIAPAVEQSDIVMVLFNPSSLDIATENQTIFNFIG